MQNSGLDEAQAGLKISGRNISNFRYADDTLMAESKEELKSLLMKLKEESEKAGLTLNIQKLRSWHPVLSLHGKQMRKKWKQWQTIFLGSKITADGECSHEFKRHLLLGRKAMTNLDSILKSRDITFPTKLYTVKAMVFPVFMYGCESWHQRKLSAKELMLLNCTVREDSSESLGLQEIQPVHPKGNQSWTFVERTDVEAEAPIPCPPDGKNWFIWKDPDAGKDWGLEEKGMTEDEMVRLHHQLNGDEFG